MSTDSAYLSVGGLHVDVVYKDIKNVHVAVYPPVGRVRVSAPSHMTEDQVRLVVVQHLSWIKRQQKQLRDADRQSRREMVSGESHYVWGRRLRLKVIERPGRPRVCVDAGRLVLEVPAEANEQARTEVLERWQRRQLRDRLPALIDKWAPRMGTDVPPWGVRRMKTKWGTCSRKTGRLWFNLELAKKDPRCLEYIVVHEMAHLIEPSHGDRFVQLMDEFMPDWRARRDELNQAPLAEEVWVA